MARLGWVFVVLVVLVMNTCEAAEELPTACGSTARSVAQMCTVFGEHTAACTASRKQLATMCHQGAELGESLEGGASAVVPKWEKVAATTDWSAAKKKCETRSAKLCTKAQLCKSGKLVGHAKFSGDHWVATGDKTNSWMQAGSAHSPCLLHHDKYGLPAWGTKSSSHAFRTNLACCGAAPSSSLVTRAVRQSAKAKRVAKGIATKILKWKCHPWAQVNAHSIWGKAGKSNPILYGIKMAGPGFSSRSHSYAHGLAVGKCFLPTDIRKNPPHNVCPVGGEKGHEGWANLASGGHSYEKASQGIAGPEIWGQTVGHGRLKGVEACFKHVMVDPRCKKDYFSYVTRGDRNCGCKGPGPYRVRPDAKADNFKIVKTPTSSSCDIQARSCELPATKCSSKGFRIDTKMGKEAAKRGDPECVLMWQMFNKDIQTINAGSTAQTFLEFLKTVNYGKSVPPDCKTTKIKVKGRL